MNATYKARIDAMANQFRSLGIDPKVGFSMLAAQTGGSLLGIAASAGDLVSGETNALNSGELPLNMLYGTLPTGGAIAGHAAGSALNSLIDERKFVDSRVAETKAGLKDYARQHGADAAAAKFAGAKGEAELRLKGRQNINRFAGATLGSLLGVGIGISKIQDPQPSLQVNPTYG